MIGGRQLLVTEILAIVRRIQRRMNLRAHITPAWALRDPGGTSHVTRTSSHVTGPLGARGGPRRPPPGFVDLTADADEEEENMDKAPATPSPNVSNGDEMDTDDEEDLLPYHGMDHDHSSSDEDGFQHV